MTEILNFLLSFLFTIEASMFFFGVAAGIAFKLKCDEIRCRFYRRAVRHSRRY